jgi:hypothetical protein
MSRSISPSRRQFSLRSLFIGLTWLALLLAVCVQYQRAVAKQREFMEVLIGAPRTKTAVGGDAPAGWQARPTGAKPAE